MKTPGWRNIDRRDIVLAAYWVCLVIVFLALRAKQLEAILDDESIAVKISQAMRARRSLDPNWRFADLPHYFRYDQYNFYLYNVLAHAVITGGGWLHLAPLFALRWANVPFQLAALAFTADAARRIGAGRFTVALVGALIALAPGMVQDASLARPESFLYLLSALFLWVLTLPLAERWRMLLAGAVLGTGIAVKLTFGSLAIVLPFLVPIRGRGMRDLAATAVSFAAGAAIAIAALAPYALIHFDVYLNGIAALVAQYTGVHPPHALPVYDAVSQVAWIGGYFFQLYGFALPAALVAPFLLQGAAVGPGAGHRLPRPVHLFRLEDRLFRAQFRSRAHSAAARGRARHRGVDAQIMADRGDAADRAPDGLLVVADRARDLDTQAARPVRIRACPRGGSARALSADPFGRRPGAMRHHRVARPQRPVDAILSGEAQATRLP